ncbi:hypothetical protein Lal_00033683 [Lupinus albus]|nr:hypothetical protein Lal_00033683 [Lupinus albus]
MSQTEETEDENTEQPTDETNPNDDMNYRPPKDDKQPTGPQTGKETHSNKKKEKDDEIWRGIASQVLPRLEEDEQITIFINTLPNPFFEKMIGNNTSDFNSLIKVGDRIEQSIKAGKIAAEQTVESKKPNYAKKKEAEAHYVSGESHNPQTKTTITCDHTHLTLPTQRTFDPIPVTYAELFAHPQTERILAPIAGQTPNTTAPWYDPNANCNYHFGIIGHSTETCRALKHRIQDLIDSKWLEFKDTVPTITGNPLPNHENQG